MFCELRLIRVLRSTHGPGPRPSDFLMYRREASWLDVHKKQIIFSGRYYASLRASPIGPGQRCVSELRLGGGPGSAPRDSSEDHRRPVQTRRPDQGGWGRSTGKPPALARLFIMRPYGASNDSPKEPQKNGSFGGCAVCLGCATLHPAVDTNREREATPWRSTDCPSRSSRLST